MVRKFTKWDILIPYLYDYQKTMLLADFERELDKPHQTVKRYLVQLIQEKVITEDERKKHTTYRLNLENPLTFTYLGLAEKFNLFSRLEENRMVKRLFEKCSDFFSTHSFLVFGSYAVGREGNDIDLFVIGECDDELEGVLDKFGKTYKKIHKVQVKNKKELNKSFLKELLRKHIIFNNSDLFVQLFGDLYGKIGLV
ncbi:MAG: nucleotidyltransferase domain-containing protein [Candidatus Aenigmatarchaeota archaeon]